MLPAQYRTRLYLNDAKALHFESTIQEWSSFSKSPTTKAQPSVLLAQSAFYPEAGGQPSDHGTLTVGDVVHSVIDVQLDAEGRVHHILANAPAFTESGLPVIGDVNEVRRRQYRASHSGQHLLSRALFEACGAQTMSARLGEASSTIDLDRVLSDEEVNAALTLANTIVDEDRTLNAFFPTPAQLQTLKLRKSPTVNDDIRVVEIEGFDATPCGGTHCERTGEIQLLHVSQLEKRKRTTRVHFVCGPRARDFLRRSDALLRDLAKRYTCGKDEISTLLEKGQRDNKELRDRLSALQAERIDRIARGLDEGHDDEALIIWVDETLDIKEAPALLGALCARLARASRVVAVVGGHPKAHCVIARGEKSDFDCKAAFTRLTADDENARGGGRPTRAQGTFDTEKICEGFTEGNLNQRLNNAMSRRLQAHSEN